MLVDKFLKNLQHIVSDYPFPRVRKILSHCVITMLEIRSCEGYELTCINLAEKVACAIGNAVRAEGSNDNPNFKYDMYKLAKSLVSLAYMSDTETGKIKEYCVEIAPPKKEDSLEGFLIRKLDAKSIRYDLRISPIVSANEMYIFAFTEVDAGKYDEMFVLRAGKPFSQNCILEDIQNYYMERGHQIEYADDVGISVRKDGVEKIISYSAYGPFVVVTAAESWV